MRGIHRWPVNSPHKRPVTRKKFSFDDVVMLGTLQYSNRISYYINQLLFSIVEYRICLQSICCKYTAVYIGVCILVYHLLRWMSWVWPWLSCGWSHSAHWGRVTHICVGNLTIIGSDNGLSPGRRQAITWTNVGIWLIGPLGTNFSEMLIEIHAFSFKKIHLKMSSGKWRPFCLGLNVFIHCC